MFRFPKKQRLSNKKEIESLFLKNYSFEESPFRVLWTVEKNENQSLIKTIIIVSKKKLKLAIDRNRMKRIIKESYRLNKNILESSLSGHKKQINLAIIYQRKNTLKYNLIEEKIKIILKRLQKEI